ncbi:GNAT family N-acetyltransferase [Anaerovorax odorimutans]|uniref:GNAT family N-acetyltransferase n=2 Tax=Anaerovorax odorimutans TaxID=109327 RepID=A0ABT1RSL8_9FIRM|nr:GNAT family N-acetyltransferase [Anaerovorax odorimutans]MCQ4638212.1 GNAT family N-acetyltransferase [Anaerovorax odorimutans]
MAKRQYKNRYGFEIEPIRDYAQALEKASCWFSRKWDVPEEAYRESMEACISQQTGIPQWYIVENEEQEIIAGAGVIDNDFHQRKDLAPNLCALYVEEDYRNQGIASRILDFARRDLSRLGFSKLYLITDHTEFYEKCGWDFFTMVCCDGGEESRMYMAETR